MIHGGWRLARRERFSLRIPARESLHQALFRREVGGETTTLTAASGTMGGAGRQGRTTTDSSGMPECVTRGGMRYNSLVESSGSIDACTPARGANGPGWSMEE